MSFSINNTVIAGRLASDPEIRTIPGDKPLTAATYRVAVNRRRREGEAQVDFISCESFGAQAEFLKLYMKKGSPILIEGRIRAESYNDKAGVRKYVTKVIGNRVSSEKDGNLNWNTVQLAGRLTRDPETRTSSGTSVAKFSLAVDRNTSKKDADFITCTCFGKMAETATTYLKKGKGVCIRGRIQTGDYINKDGIKVYTTEVVVEDFRFTRTKGAGSGSAEPQLSAAPQTQQADPTQTQAEVSEQAAAPQVQQAVPVQAQQADPAPQTQQAAPVAADDLDEIWAETGLDEFVSIPDGLDGLDELPFVD